MIRKVQISDKYFWGFNRLINIDKCKSNDDIVFIILNMLEEFLLSNNLLQLNTILDDTKKEYHIHDKFEKILQLKYEETIYVCNHECSN